MENVTIFQFFHWYTSWEDNLWKRATSEASCLVQLGVTHVWLPPAYKSAYGGSEPGYAVYDLYDLGEFDQKGSVRTKYGTKDEYLECIKALHDNGIQVLADTVLNHKLGGDEEEEFPAKKVDPENRNEMGEKMMIKDWTKFYFPVRNGKYSEYVWDWHSFTGVSQNDHDIFMILNEHANEEWDEMMEEEKGNYDYLMGADIEFRNPNVREELKHWGKWYVDFTGVDGFRLDALKHIGYHFFTEWIDHLNEHFKKKFFFIGEYWRSDVDVLMRYADYTQNKIQLFDVPLHFNFHVASISENNYDMRAIFDGSLLQSRPEIAITFVDNHDTQPMQSLQSPVETWFKPHAYALILLREQGIPCAFYPALYGCKYKAYNGETEIDIDLPQIQGLGTMMRARKCISYGMQRDYIDHANTIGWTREGTEELEGSGLAVVLTNGSYGDKTMEIGKRHSGKTFIDITGDRTDRVVIDEEGMGTFTVGDRSVSVWMSEEYASKIKGDDN